MALSANTVWEIRQGGSDTNGGGFVTGAAGTDWSQQNAAQYSVTDAVTAGTTTITSATANFGTDVVGNICYVQGGTGSVTAGWYEITARSSTTSITVDRSTGLTAGTGVTLKIGGALGTPGVLTSVTGGVGGSLVSGQKAWVKYSATPFALTTDTAGPAGPCSLPASIAISVEGYDQSRGDRTGNRPVNQWQTAPGALTFGYVSGGSAAQRFINLAVDGNSQTNAAGFNVAVARAAAIQCTASNCNQTGVYGFSVASGHAMGCIASNCTTGYFNNGVAACIKCVATGGTTGFTNVSSLFECLAYSVPTGFNCNTTNLIASRCTADSCSTYGFHVLSQATFDSCLATNCTGSGIGFNSGTNLSTLLNCAYYNNNTNVAGTPLINEGAIALSADPYVSQGTADYRPNATTGGGTALRGTAIGVPGQTDNQDVGAVQHSDSASGTCPIYMSMP